MPVWNHISACLCALLCSIMPLTAQNQGGFYGSVDINAGANFRTDEGFGKFSRQSGEAKMKLGYSTHNFDVQFNASALGSYKTNNKVGISFNSNEGSKTLDFDITLEERKESAYSFGLSSTYTPNSADRIKIDFSQTFNNENPLSIITTVALLNEGKMSFSSEEGFHRKETSHVLVNYSHLFDKAGRMLDTKLDITHRKTDKNTSWEKGTARMTMDDDGEMDVIFDDEEGSYKKYRLTPYNVSEVFLFESRFVEPDFAGIEKLNMIFSLTGQVRKEDDEYIAANWVNEEWVDSLRYRESFDYLSLIVDPCIKAEWNIGQFSFTGELTPEYYSDKLDDATHSGTFHPDRISPLVFLQAKYSPGKGHTLKGNVRRSVTRPEYLQKCWFQRQGSYINELYEGNADLRPSTSNRFTADYTFSAGRFSSDLELGHTYVSDKIEKVYHTDMLDGNERRIYTWINAGYSHTSNAKLALKWNATRIKTDISGNYNYYIGVVNSGKETRNADYSIAGNLGYTFPKIGLSIQTKGRYQSKIIRSYSTMTEYVSCDARIEKKFKHFNIYLEGLDLFDTEIMVLTLSEDQTQGREEVYTYNRRLFLLGASYNF